MLANMFEISINRSISNLNSKLAYINVWNNQNKVSHTKYVNYIQCNCIYIYAIIREYIFSWKKLFFSHGYFVSKHVTKYLNRSTTNRGQIIHFLRRIIGTPCFKSFSMVLILVYFGTLVKCMKLEGLCNKIYLRRRKTFKSVR